MTQRNPVGERITRTIVDQSEAVMNNDTDTFRGASYLSFATCAVSVGGTLHSRDLPTPEPTPVVEESPLPSIMDEYDRLICLGK